jgi:hypothetical protein
MKLLTTFLACVLLGVPGFVSANPADTEQVTQTELLKRLEQKDPDLVVLDAESTPVFSAAAPATLRLTSLLPRM